MDRITYTILDGKMENHGVKPEHIKEAVERLAAYEDTGLSPEEVIVVKNIVGRIATADYPHNFQHERADIVTYMYWITSVMKDAKEWWNSMATQKGNEYGQIHKTRRTNRASIPR